MCGRYYVDDNTAKEIERLLQKLDNRLKVAHKSGDVYPTNSAMIVKGENEKLILDEMIWGFPQYQKKGVIFNTRSESALEKKTFSNSTRSRRCLIPAKGFYEWDSVKNKISFERQDGDTMLLAGIWNNFGLDRRFTILTTDANETMHQIHDRMPLIIEPEEAETWLFDESCVEFMLNKIPCNLAIVEGNYQQKLDL
ncbi:SOS response-associated peptidase [Konateibacter massiliensis]|uniref:SOS response-associated peptidase n=1 Tax=Konateibacter massiliensis TaxID=2002841 RepID=UPI000C14A18A|nr:SOS response-associated peptidase [Konateibacter massiliensis]